MRRGQADQCQWRRCQIKLHENQHKKHRGKNQAQTQHDGKIHPSQREGAFVGKLHAVARHDCRREDVQNQERGEQDGKHAEEHQAQAAVGRADLVGGILRRG